MDWVLAPKTDDAFQITLRRHVNGQFTSLVCTVNVFGNTKENMSFHGFEWQLLSCFKSFFTASECQVILKTFRPSDTHRITMIKITESTGKIRPTWPKRHGESMFFQQKSRSKLSKWLKLDTGHTATLFSTQNRKDETNRFRPLLRPLEPPTARWALGHIFSRKARYDKWHQVARRRSRTTRGPKWSLPNDLKFGDGTWMKMDQHAK